MIDHRSETETGRLADFRPHKTWQAYRPVGSISPTRRMLALTLLCAVLGLLLAGCDNYAAKTKIPARIAYMEGESKENQGLLADAIAKYKEVADQNPGTLLGSFSFLKMGDLNFALGEWVEAETNYRLFLITNQQSHLTSYVLYKLVVVQQRKSITGVFFPSREIERNIEPNRRIILEYQRFFFLFPKSIFLKEIKQYLTGANEALAAYEHMVADFYFNKAQFNAASSRYLYLLKNFPQYPKSEQVLRRLIESYKKDRQTDLAKELETFYQNDFKRWREAGKKKKAATPAAAQSVTPPGGRTSAARNPPKGNPPPAVRDPRGATAPLQTQQPPGFGQPSGFSHPPGFTLPPG